MAKVKIVEWNGKINEYEGTYSKCEEIFHDYMNPFNPDRVKHWGQGYLYDDVGLIKATRKNISKEVAQIAYDTILRKLNGKGGAFTEDFITELTYGSSVYTQKLVKAWVAYGITEKQGGMWVIQ